MFIFFCTSVGKRSLYKRPQLQRKDLYLIDLLKCHKVSSSLHILNFENQEFIIKITYNCFSKKKKKFRPLKVTIVSTRNREIFDDIYLKKKPKTV